MVSFAVLDVSTLEILPSLRTVTLGVDEELVSLNCSVRAHPLPLLQWSRDGVTVDDGDQAPTGFMETAFSTLTVNVTELGVGTHNFQCTAIVDTPATQPESSVIDTNITVQALLNINIFPEMQTFLLDGSSNEPNTTELTCSVDASPPPSIVWLRNGTVVQEGPVDSANGIVFFSSLVLTLRELEVGENNITCSAFLNNSTPSVNTVDIATVIINGM